MISALSVACATTCSVTLRRSLGGLELKTRLFDFEIQRQAQFAFLFAGDFQVRLRLSRLGAGQLPVPDVPLENAPPV